MAITRARPPDIPPPRLQPLVRGERLSQAEFHVRYEAMPPEFRAELIEGVVHVMPSPVTIYHGQPHGSILVWLGEYVAAIPGLRMLSDATVILGPAGEVQPDAVLYVLPPNGRAVETEDGYLSGAPELVVEIAYATSAKDLGTKRAEYERAGVQEYLVVLPKEGRVRWFAMEEGRYVAMAPGADGLFRSRGFPGLWLDPKALLGDDLARLKAVAQQGLASEERQR